MTLVLRTRLLSLLLLSASLAIADPALRGPVAGFLVDARSLSIRPINGIAGSSSLGPPLTLPFAIRRAVFASQGDFAVALSAEDSQLWLVRDLSAEQPSVTPLPVSIAGIELFVLNVEGSAAAFYSPDQGALQIVTGLPDNPSSGPALALSTLPGRVIAMALDGSASSALLAAKGPTGMGEVFLVQPAPDGNPAPKFLMQTPEPMAVAYINHDAAALVADRSASQIFIIRDVRGSADVSLAATQNDGIAGPMGLQVSSDGTQFLVANGDGNSVTVHDLASLSLIRNFSLVAPPAALEKINGHDVFLLNGLPAPHVQRRKAPVFLLDATADLHVYFVPVE